MGEIFAGRYELLAPIGASNARSVGRGSRSAWVVRDLELDQPAAARILPQSDSYSLLRVVRKYADQLDGAHVIIPLSSVTERGRVLFPMPLATGGSVSSWLERQGALPPLVVAELMRQLLSALQGVHSAGLVHRDVRPANLLLRATGAERPWLYLSDFALATAMEADTPRVTRGGHALADPLYMAPELRAGSEPSPASDLWAVGAVAEELLTGQPPRGAAMPHLPLSAPPELVEVVVALSSPTPTRRPDAARAADLLQAPGLRWLPDMRPGIDVPDRFAEILSTVVPGARPNLGSVTASGRAPVQPVHRALPIRPEPVDDRVDPGAVNESEAAPGDAKPVHGEQISATVGRSGLPQRPLRATPVVPARRPAEELGQSAVSAIRPSARSETSARSEQEPALREPMIGERDSESTHRPESTEPVRRRAGLRWLWLGLPVLLLLVAVPSLRQDPSPEEGSSVAPSSVASSAPSESSEPESQPSPSAGPSSSGSPGTLQTRTVVLRVGQPCLEPDASETTIAGLAVTCRLEAGNLVWSAD